MTSAREKLFGFFRSVHDHSLPSIDQSTVAIVGLKGEEMHHDRSGVLFGMGEEHFVLTAAHDLREYLEHEVPLAVSTNVLDSYPVPFGKAFFLGTEENERDLAAIWIRPEMAAELKKTRAFIHQDQIVRRPAPGSQYVFFGYPIAWSGKPIEGGIERSLPLVFSTSEANIKPTESDRFDPAIHMIVTFGHDGINALTTDKGEIPSLKGISGCGIWHVGTIRNGEIYQLPPKNIGLVAIQHGKLPVSGYVKATRIEYVLDRIIDEPRFSHLRKLTAIHVA